jgi:UDP-N-acetylglucosamine:LPS N-acetylglucosamine transferase
VKDFLILAIGGAGGDLQPLVAAALAVRERGIAFRSLAIDPSDAH